MFCASWNLMPKEAYSVSLSSYIQFQLPFWIWVSEQWTRLLCPLQPRPWISVLISSHKLNTKHNLSSLWPSFQSCGSCPESPLCLWHDIHPGGSFHCIASICNALQWCALLWSVVWSGSVDRVGAVYFTAFHFLVKLISMQCAASHTAAPVHRGGRGADIRFSPRLLLHNCIHYVVHTTF